MTALYVWSGIVVVILVSILMRFRTALAIYLCVGIAVVIVTSILMRDSVDRSHRLFEITAVQIVLIAIFGAVGYMLFGK